MPRDFPNVMMSRFPSSGGSQGTPRDSHRRLVIGSWLVAYLCFVAAACLSTSLGPKAFAAAWGAPPVVLFGGLTILGNLTPKCAWVFVILWVIVCGTVALGSILAITGGLSG